jgi:chromosome segregation ATPase
MADNKIDPDIVGIWATIEGLSHQVDTLHQANQELRDDLEQARRAMTSGQRERASLLVDLRQRQEQVRALERKLAAREEALEQVKEERAGAVDQIRRLRQQLEQAAARAEAHQKNIAQLQEIILSHDLSLVEPGEAPSSVAAREEKARLEANIHELEQENDFLRRKLELLELSHGALEQLRGTMRHLRSRMEAEMGRPQPPQSDPPGAKKPG